MQHIEDARRDLVQFMQDSGKSQRQISKETGLSATRISQFLGGTYMGDTEETAKEIQKYLTVAKARLNTVQTGNFYPELRNTKDVLFACMYAHKHNDVALVCGDARRGKNHGFELLRQEQRWRHYGNGQRLHPVSNGDFENDLCGVGQARTRTPGRFDESACRAAARYKPPHYRG